MALKKPYANYAGKQKELQTGDTLDPAYILSGLAAMAAASAAINTTETILTSFVIPANFLKAGSTFRIDVFGTCTSTVANASNIRVRIGTAGTSADVVAAIVTPTAAASGTAIPFCVTLMVTIRTVGSGGTMGGSGVLNNNGVTGISAAAVVVGTPTAVAINTTVQNTIQVSYSSAATTTTSTFQLAAIELVKL